MRVDHSHLEKALIQHWPELHHSDHFKQWAAMAHTQTLWDHTAKIRMADGGKLVQNWASERHTRITKN